MQLDKTPLVSTRLTPACLMDILYIDHIHTEYNVNDLRTNTIIDFHSNPHNHYCVVRGSLSCMYLAYFEFGDGATQAMLMPYKEVSKRDIVLCLRDLGKLCHDELIARGLASITFGWEDGKETANKINDRIGSYLVKAGWTCKQPYWDE